MSDDGGLKSARLLVVAVVGLVFLLVFVRAACLPDKGKKEDAAAHDDRAEPVSIIVDVTSIIGESRASVAASVGSEPSCEPDTVPGRGEGVRCKWTQPEIDALFYEDKLVHATITGGGLAFAASSGAAYGIESAPKFRNDNVIRWDVDGYEAAIFPNGSGQVEYFYLAPSDF